jgi:6-phospho-beta-glucosidase
MLRGNHVNLAVIGGSSLVTPALIAALRDAVSTNRLPPTRVRLWGRDQFRLERILELSHFQQAEEFSSESQEQIDLSICDSLESAVTGATHILCQVRPGGMAARAHDEQMAIQAGVPGDEGIGPAGLSAFLRGRPVTDNILRACATVAPSAVFLQMTSPLGLTTALANQHYPERAYGVCELPNVISTRVLAHIQSKVKNVPLTWSLAGLNHQSWLYAFKDRAGFDRTHEVLCAITDDDLLGVDSHVIVEQGAVPMPYLRLYLHSDRELARQQAVPQTRGDELIEWSQHLSELLRDGTSASFKRALALIAFRKPDWYKHGVIPVLAALASPNESIVALNVRNQGAITDVSEDAIVETMCVVTSGAANPLPAPPLPPGPDRLTRQLVGYEQAVLALPATPTELELEEVLAMHPLVPSAVIGILAKSIHGSLKP